MKPIPIILCFDSPLSLFNRLSPNMAVGAEAAGAAVVADTAGAVELAAEAGAGVGQAVVGERAGVGERAVAPERVVAVQPADEAEELVLLA